MDRYFIRNISVSPKYLCLTVIFVAMILIYIYGERVGIVVDAGGGDGGDHCCQLMTATTTNNNNKIVANSRSITFHIGLNVDSTSQTKDTMSKNGHLQETSYIEEKSLQKNSKTLEIVPPTSTKKTVPTTSTPSVSLRMIKRKFNKTRRKKVKNGQELNSVHVTPSNFSTTPSNAITTNHLINNNSMLQTQTVYRTYNKDTWTAKRKLPQALIIGVKKGGTRALLEFIRLHPDVRAVGPETHFFDRNYHKGLEWYRRHMPASLEGQITMEKTPSYFVTKEVPRRVYNMSREVKLLVVVRDPVTRAISDYAQTISKRKDIKPFEQLAFLNNATGLVDTSWMAIKLGVYARHLERWLQYFPRSHIHFVSGELLIKDPAGEMAKVQDFLGVRRIITENHFYFNETKGFPCLKKSERNGSPKCLGRTKGRTHPNIDPSAIQRLRDFYRPFNAKLYLMAGVNFEWP